MKPKIAVFDFASCEGCELQIANLEEEVVALAGRVDVVSFREVMKEHSDEYDIALVEGCIQRPMDAQRLREIRARARVLIALGDCAVTGCINKLRNEIPVKEALQDVYGSAKPGEPKLFELKKAQALDEVVDVDFYIRGCPARKEQILYYIKRFSGHPPHKNLNPRFGMPEKLKEEDERSLVRYNPRKCILCRRCDAVCGEALGIDALGIMGKGLDVQLGTPRNISFDENGCIRCGQCISCCSVGALEAPSTIAQLIAELRSGALSIAIDPVVLSSLPERFGPLSGIPPHQVEEQVVSALKQAGFRRVVSYMPYLNLSRELDEGGSGKTPRMSSWCKAAFDYIGAENIDGDEGRSPWALLLADAQKRNEKMCLASPCTAMKGVAGFAHVLSVMDLDELFKHLEIDISHCERAAYDEGESGWLRHPGIERETKGKALKVNREAKAAVRSLAGGERFELYPCLRRCVSGGGNYPTVDQSLIQSRRAWLSRLWEMHS